MDISTQSISFFLICDKQDILESYETIRKASDVSNTSKLSCGNFFVYYHEFTQDWILYLGLEYSYTYWITIYGFQLAASLLEEVRVPQLTTEVIHMGWRQHSSKSLDKIRCRLYLVQAATFVQFLPQATVIW